MRGGPDPRATRWIAVRIAIVAGLLGAGFVAVAARAFQLQVLQGDALAGEAADQYVRQLSLRPRRGVVTDRSGVLLAGSADAESVFVDPKLFLAQDGAGRILHRLAGALALDGRAVQKKLVPGSRFAWLKRRISPAEGAAVKAILASQQPKGVRVVPETRRYYPKLELASQVLGIVGDEGNGLEGIELEYDELLRGEPAKVPSLRDGRGNIALHDAAPGGGREGARVELTLDQGLQSVAERALASAVTGSRALSGVALAIDPRTGEVLAMASWPPFNPNAPRRGDELRNRALTDTFEAGSTVKTFTIAAALDRGVLRPLDPIDCGDGSYAIGAHVIHDHKALGWVGPSKVLAASSNVGAAKIAARLGKRGLHDALLAFGFGERTDVDFPGERRGQLPFPSSDITLATQAFGQGLTATALQITDAMAAIANGGVLMQPWMVRRTLDPATGEVLEQATPTPVRRVVSAETAATVSRWLVGVVEDPVGTGKRARLEGWRLAGKTGTAQKADPVSGGYSHDRHFSSFVGFAPAEGARIVIGVFVDEPKGEIYGGEVAAPAFRDIAEYAMKMFGVPPTGPTATAAAPVAPSAPTTVATREAADAAEAGGPPPVELADRRSARPAGSGVAVPPLAGLPARTAIRTLEASDLAVEVAGSGRVVSQSPGPGKVVERGARVRITLAPPG